MATEAERRRRRRFRRRARADNRPQRQQGQGKKPKPRGQQPKKPSGPRSRPAIGGGGAPSDSGTGESVNANTGGGGGSSGSGSGGSGGGSNTPSINAITGGAGVAAAEAAADDKPGGQSPAQAAEEAAAAYGPSGVSAGTPSSGPSAAVRRARRERRQAVRETQQRFRQQQREREREQAQAEREREQRERERERERERRERERESERDKRENGPKGEDQERGRRQEGTPRGKFGLGTRDRTPKPADERSEPRPEKPPKQPKQPKVRPKKERAPEKRGGAVVTALAAGGLVDEGKVEPKKLRRHQRESQDSDPTTMSAIGGAKLQRRTEEQAERAERREAVASGEKPTRRVQKLVRAARARWRRAGPDDAAFAESREQKKLQRQGMAPSEARATIETEIANRRGERKATRRFVAAREKGQQHLSREFPEYVQESKLAEAAPAVRRRAEEKGHPLSREEAAKIVRRKFREEKPKIERSRELIKRFGVAPEEGDRFWEQVNRAAKSAPGKETRQLAKRLLAHEQKIRHDVNRGKIAHKKGERLVLTPKAREDAQQAALLAAQEDRADRSLGEMAGNFIESVGHIPQGVADSVHAGWLLWSEGDTEGFEEMAKGFDEGSPLWGAFKSLAGGGSVGDAFKEWGDRAYEDPLSAMGEAVVAGAGARALTWRAQYGPDAKGVRAARPHLSLDDRAAQGLFGQQSLLERLRSTQAAKRQAQGEQAARAARARRNAKATNKAKAADAPKVEPGEFFKSRPIEPGQTRQFYSRATPVEVLQKAREFVDAVRGKHPFAVTGRRGARRFARQADLARRRGSPSSLALGAAIVEALGETALRVDRRRFTPRDPMRTAGFELRYDDTVRPETAEQDLAGYIETQQRVMDENGDPAGVHANNIRIAMQLKADMDRRGEKSVLLSEDVGEKVAQLREIGLELDQARVKLGEFSAETAARRRGVAGPLQRGEVRFREEGETLDNGDIITEAGFYNADGSSFAVPESVVSIERHTVEGPERVYSREDREVAAKSISQRQARARFKKGMKARRSERRKVSEYDPSPEGIAGRTYYHGTRHGGVVASELSRDLTKPNNLFGQGVYLTSSPGVARGYSGNRDVRRDMDEMERESYDYDVEEAGFGEIPQPGVYRVEVAPERVLDLEAPADDGFIRLVQDGFDDIEEFFPEEVLADAYQLTRDAAAEGWSARKLWMEVIKSLLVYAKVTAADAKSASLNARVLGFQTRLNTALAGRYDAMTHKGGGLAGTRRHQVVVLLDPEGARSGLSSGRPMVFRNRREQMRQPPRTEPGMPVWATPRGSRDVERQVEVEVERPVDPLEQGGYVDPQAVQSRRQEGGLELAGERGRPLETGRSLHERALGEENVRATLEGSGRKIGQEELRQRVSMLGRYPGRRTQESAQKLLDQLNRPGEVQYVAVAVGKGSDAPGSVETWGREARPGELVYVVPEAAVKMWERMTAPAGRIRSGAEFAAQKFVSAVLPFSASWHAGNQIDLLTRAVVAGVNPFSDPVIAAAMSRRMQELDPARGRNTEAWLTGHFGSREDVIEAATVGKALAPAKSRLGQAAARASRGLHENRFTSKLFPLHFGAQKGFDLATRMERPFERGARGRAGRLLARDLGMDIRDHVKLGERLAEQVDAEPGLVEEFGRRTLEILGDYSRSPFTEQVLMNVFPFWTWMREANRFIFYTLPAKHPVKMALIAMGGQLSYDAAERLGLHDLGDGKFMEDLEGFLTQAIPVPGAEGWYVPTSPFTAWGEAAQLLDDPWSYVAARPFPYLQQVGAVATGHMFYDTFGELALREISEGRLLEQLGIDAKLPEIALPGFDAPSNEELVMFQGDRSDAVLGELIESFVPGGAAYYQAMVGGFPSTSSTFFDPQAVPGTEVPWWQNRALNPFGRVLDLDAIPMNSKHEPPEPTEREARIARHQLEKGTIIYNAAGNPMRWNGEEFVAAGNPRGRHDGTRTGKGSEGEKRRDVKRKALDFLERTFPEINSTDDRATAAIVEASRKYDVPPEVLASIYQIESAFGTNQGPSTAGALGHMQFMPETWDAYGVDGDGDGQADPANAVDAIHSAGNYLNASGASEDLRGAIFAYNHADWYVDDVLAGAEQFRAREWKQAGTGAAHAVNEQPDPVPARVLNKHLIRLEGDEDIKHLDPGLQRALVELSRRSGEPVRIESGNRSNAEQAVLYQAYLNGTGNLAAPPGESNHNHGQAVDAQLTDAQYGLLAEVGLHQPVGGEPWHLELVNPGAVPAGGQSAMAALPGGGVTTSSSGVMPAVGNLPAVPPGEMTALGIDPVKAAKRRAIRRIGAQLRANLTMMLLNGELSPLEYVQRLTGQSVRSDDDALGDAGRDSADFQAEGL